VVRCLLVDCFRFVGMVDWLKGGNHRFVEKRSVLVIEVLGVRVGGNYIMPLCRFCWLVLFVEAATVEVGIDIVIVGEIVAGLGVVVAGMGFGQD